MQAETDWITENKTLLGILFSGAGLAVLALLRSQLLALWRWLTKRPKRFCNLPVRNKAFTGRKGQLEELHTALKGARAVAITQVIKGLGGVGKTQMAIEYAHRHERDYHIRWIIRAETPQEAKLDLVSLGLLLEPQVADIRELDQQVAHTLQLLNNAEKALLIYDNVEKPEDLSGLTPAARGRVLITSRYTDWQTAETVSLDMFTAKEALVYFRRRGLTDGEAELRALAERLGRLPLAVAMAAGYITKQRITARQYLGEYDDHQADVLTKDAVPQDYEQEKTLAAVFERSFEAVGERDELAIELLESLAFLAPDEIPLFVLDWPEGRAPEYVSDELAGALGDERRRRGLVGLLVDYSLVERSDEILSIHRLTQDVLRHQLSQDEAAGRQRLFAAIDLVNGHVCHDVDTNLTQWPLLDALTPHVRALREAMADIPPAECLKPWPRLLNQFGLYCNTRAQYAEAKACYERALKIDEAAYGPDHPEVATDMNNLGGVLKAIDDLAGSKACYERALKIGEAAYGPDHRNVATVVNNLGGVLQEMDDLPGAKACYERAADIFSEKLGPEHPDVATVVNNLGGVLHRMDDLAGAKACVERALKIGEATLGIDHPEVGVWVYNLGAVLKAMGDLDGAKGCFERAAAIFSEKLGTEHPRTRAAMAGLAGVKRELGEHA